MTNFAVYARSIPTEPVFTDSLDDVWLGTDVFSYPKYSGKVFLGEY